MRIVSWAAVSALGLSFALMLSAPTMASGRPAKSHGKPSVQPPALPPQPHKPCNKEFPADPKGCAACCAKQNPGINSSLAECQNSCPKAK